MTHNKRNFDIKYFENYNKIDSIKVDLKKGKKEVIEKYGISEDTFNEIKEASEHEDFWQFHSIILAIILSWSVTGKRGTLSETLNPSSFNIGLKISASGLK